MSTSDYRVNLDVYNGPLDLLLYLIRREEVDIYDIPIARITEQYVSYVQMLSSLDPNLAGDFLVMAATLMEIKTRMLLPSAPAEEGEASDLEIDPRAELVRQLLEYKAFKDAAGDLRDAAETQSQRFPRRPVMPEPAEAELDLDDVQIWDLLEAFNGILEAIGADQATHDVIYDDTPIELHAEDILDRLGREGSMAFSDIFAGRSNRTEVLGLFLAVLELVRLKKILARQETNFSEIRVELNPQAPVEREPGHALAAGDLDTEALEQEGQAMVTNDTLETRKGEAVDHESGPDLTEIVDQEADEDEEEDFDEDEEEELDDDLDEDDEDLDDDDFDEEFDEGEDDEFDEDEEWDDEDEVEARASGDNEAGQYIADTHVRQADEDDSRTTAG